MNGLAGLALVKTADAGQAIGDPIGPLQGSYVNALVGLDAIENATKKQLTHPDIGKGRYNKMLGWSNKNLEQMLLPKMRKSMARQAEIPSLRLFSDLMPGELGMVADVGAGYGGEDETIQKYRDTAGKRYQELVNKYQDPYDPSAETTGRETPWHLAMQGMMANADSDVAMQRYMRAERPGHYWLNPFAKTGPLHELGARMGRRNFAGAASNESTGGRFWSGAVPFMNMIQGGEGAQQSLRNAAMQNELYSQYAQPEKIEDKKTFRPDDKVVKLEDEKKKDKKDKKEKKDKKMKKKPLKKAAGIPEWFDFDKSGPDKILGGGVLGAAGGAGLGALIGALGDQGALRGAGIGAMTGLGGGLGGFGGAYYGKELPGPIPQPSWETVGDPAKFLDYQQQISPLLAEKQVGGIAGGGIGGLAGLGTGYGLGRAMFAKDEDENNNGIPDDEETA